MATFTVPTYDVPLSGRLGQLGFSFPRSFMVVIDTGDGVTTFPGTEGLVDPDDIFDVAADGSGDNGKAVFRAGRTYTITAGENTLLDSAGYSDYLS